MKYAPSPNGAPPPAARRRPSSMNSARQPWTLQTVARGSCCSESLSLTTASQYARHTRLLIERTTKTFSGWYSVAYEM